MENAPRLIYCHKLAHEGLKANPSFVNIAHLSDLGGFSPDWPVPYILMLTRNDATVFSVSLIDSLGQTIQVNLLSLWKQGRAKSLLLGGSSRIDPAFHEYGVLPSSLTHALLRNKVVPWLAKQGYDQLFLRAHFPGADDFFGKMGFRSAGEIGPPYMVCDLLQQRLQAPTQLAEVQYTIGNPCELELRRRQDEVFALEYKYFSNIEAADTTQAKLEAHRSLRDSNRELERSVFQVQWALASELSRCFAGLLQST